MNEVAAKSGSSYIIDVDISFIPLEHLWVAHWLGNKVTKKIQVGEEPVEIDITPDGKIAVVTNFDDDTISVIDTKKNKVIKVLPAGDSPVSIAILSRGGRK
ncbi:hypothetical protein J7E63_15125 [Bacillus sp. ISL-75]|uniref:YncE family protein n=1 Tax=Bacillus sp. ISL-75 TaxID=2819137 RepID=UPI001BEC2C4D|nr:hypothetical protein [Bacillus sp. ISL-75]MBT2728265.1 hypothetical protein [Bacillus sp. ISL-75]